MGEDRPAAKLDSSPGVDVEHQHAGGLLVTVRPSAGPHAAGMDGAREMIREQLQCPGLALGSST